MLQDYDVIDDAFNQLILNPATVHLEQLWSGARWCEGPAYFPAHRTLIWSDIPNNRMLRWTEPRSGLSGTGQVDVFRAPSNFSNGNTVDRNGRLVSCEHGARRVSRTEHDGRVITLADRYQGKRLNSPNDVVVKSDGSVWFTDPSYGLLSDYEGYRSEQELPGCYVFRLAANGELHIAADDFIKPNGLAFSPDERFLYIADTARSHDSLGPAHIRRFAVHDDGRLSGGEVFADCTNGLFDGFRCDEFGNLWSSAGDGVHCYAPNGRLLGKLRVPEVVANLCFGSGAAGQANRLFITATCSLYAVMLNVRGAAVT